MILLDARRYDNSFKNIYMNTVFDLLCSLGKKDGKSFNKAMLHIQVLPDSQGAVAREIVWYLLDYGLYQALTREGTGFEDLPVPEESGISTMTDDELKAALRPLIIGKVKALRDARRLLLPPIKDGEEETGKEESYSREIKEALEKHGLMFNSKTCLICHMPEEGEEKDPQLLDHIPYKKEKEVRKDPGEQRKQQDEKILEIYDLLDKRWGFLGYLYNNAYESLRSRAPVCGGDRRWTGMTISSCLVSLLELRSCPYCNRNYIGTVGKKNLGYQLDHYISKSIYPLFCLSLYNLVPSCTVCNLGKSDKDEIDVLSPFEEGIDYEGVLDFDYDPPLKTKEKQGSIKINVKDETEKRIGKAKAVRYEKTIEAFDLNNCYKFNAADADAFIQKMVYYPPSMITELGRTMFRLNNESKKGQKNDTAGKITENSLLEERMIEEAIFAEGMEEIYHKRPLSMMYRHLYRKYRE